MTINNWNEETDWGKNDWGKNDWGKNDWGKNRGYYGSLLALAPKHGLLVFCCQVQKQ